MSEVLSKPSPRHEHDEPPWCEDCIARCSCGQYLHGVRVPVRTIYDGPQYQWRPISERKAKRIIKRHAREFS